MASHYPDINAGSGILAARGNLVAQMAQVQNQAQENANKSIQNIADTFHKHQDRIDKQKERDEEKEFRAKSFAEQQRMNNANIELQKKRNQIAKQEADTNAKIGAAKAYATTQQGRQIQQDVKITNDFINKEKEYEEKLKAEQKAKAEAAQNNNNITPINEPQAQNPLYNDDVIKNLIKQGVRSPIAFSKGTK